MSQPYEPARLRQVRILLWVVVVGGAALAVAAAAYLLGGADPRLVLLVLALPSVLMLGLGAKTLQLVGRLDPGVKPWVVATAGVTILVALLLSRTSPGLLIGLVGVLLLLVGVLPSRDPR